MGGAWIIVKMYYRSDVKVDIVAMAYIYCAKKITNNLVEIKRTIGRRVFQHLKNHQRL